MAGFHSITQTCAVDGGCVADVKWSADFGIDAESEPKDACVTLGYGEERKRSLVSIGNCMKLGRKKYSCSCIFWTR